MKRTFNSFQNMLSGEKYEYVFQEYGLFLDKM